MAKVLVDHAGRWCFEDLDLDHQPPLRRHEGTISFDAGDGKGVAEQYGGRTPSEEMTHLMENEERAYSSLLEELNLPPERRDYPSATTKEERDKMREHIYSGDIQLYDALAKKVNPALSKGFPGASKLHVASMPGADGPTYNNVVLQCLDHDISFGIVYEGNWLGVWFRVWRHLQQLARDAGKEFLVLTKPDGSVGFNQSIEVAYLTEEGIPFRHMRASDFLHYTAPLITACCYEGKRHLVEELLEHEHVAVLLRQRDYTGQQALHRCVHWGADLVQLVLDKQADIEARSFIGGTPLNKACQRNFDTEVVRVLLRAGAHVNTANCEGVTPLWQAAKHDLQEHAQLLLEGQAAIDQARDDRTTPLYEACVVGHCSMVRWLLDAKAAVDPIARGGYTPLMHAAWKGRLEIALALAERKADFGKKDNNGLGALDHAKAHPELASSLAAAALAAASWS